MYLRIFSTDVGISSSFFERSYFLISVERSPILIEDFLLSVLLSKDEAMLTSLYLLQISSYITFPTNSST
jgi:hypothetical protein